MTLTVQPFLQEMSGIVGDGLSARPDEPQQVPGSQGGLGLFSYESLIFSKIYHSTLVNPSKFGAGRISDLILLLC